MIALLAATLREAKPLLDRLLARKAADSPFQQYMAPAAPGRPACLVVISGMGKDAAARATEFLLDAHRPAAVLNFGLCGALSRDLARGAQLRIACAVDGDSVLAGRPAQAEACSPGFSCGPPRVGNLASVDEPVFDDRRRSALAEYADVVDMEGWAVAHACRRRHVPVHLLKAVSDFADADGKSDIARHIDTVSAMLAETVLKELETLVIDDHARPGEPAASPPQAAPPAGNLLARMARFVKIEHTLFSLPLLIAGAYLGAGSWSALSWLTLALVLVAGAGARTLGMAANRILDRRLDALNPRTASRDLPAGRMSMAAALAVAAIGLAAYLAACVALGPLCLKLSAIPAAAMIAYPLLKRFTSLCHFGIGLCLAMAPLGAYVAAAGSLDLDARVLLLAAFTLAWMSGFDIVYALQDVDSDRATGVRSLPAALGPRRAELVAAATHALAAAAGVALWLLAGGRLASGLAAAAMLAGFIVGHWPRLPAPARFFPGGPLVGVAGALIVLLGDLP